MILGFDSNGKPVVTDDLILASEYRFDKDLLCFGVKPNKNDWIHKSYALVRLHRENPGRFDNQEQHRKLLNAYHDCLELGLALQGLRSDESYEICREKLDQLLKPGGERYDPSGKHARGRDVLFELSLLSDLKEVGLAARLGDTNPDIMVHFKHADYHIECKRLASQGSNALQRNLHAASKQLERHPIPGVNGVLALSIGQFLLGNNPCLKARREEEAFNEINDLLDTFLETHVRFWRNAGTISDKIVGLILHVSAIAWYENYLAPTQICYDVLSDATVTKNSGGRFAQFYEDFSPLGHGETGPVWIT